jgi:hypothetical protein
MFLRIPAFFYITPHTSHITTTEPDKESRLSLVETFTLEGIKVFHYRESGTYFRFQI